MRANTGLRDKRSCHPSLTLAKGLPNEPHLIGSIPARCLDHAKEVWRHPATLCAPHSEILPLPRPTKIAVQNHRSLNNDAPTHVLGGSAIKVSEVRTPPTGRPSHPHYRPRGLISVTKRCGTRICRSQGGLSWEEQTGDRRRHPHHHATAASNGHIPFPSRNQHEVKASPPDRPTTTVLKALRPAEAGFPEDSPRQDPHLCARSRHSSAAAPLRATANPPSQRWIPELPQRRILPTTTSRAGSLATEKPDPAHGIRKPQGHTVRKAF